MLLRTKALLASSALLLLMTSGAQAQPAATDPNAPAAASAPAQSPPTAPATTAEPAQPPAAEPPASPPSPVAEAPDDGMSAVIGHPPPGMGQVVFFRNSSFMGMALSFHVREGDRVYGRLSNGRYFVLNTTPGDHDYSMVSEVTTHLHLEVEEGETQYAQFSFGMGVVAARPNLVPSDEAHFVGVQHSIRRVPDREVPRSASR